MAQRLNQSEAWLSRYLDLARLPDDVMEAFPDPFELKISHVGVLKPILKPDASRGRVIAEAHRLARLRGAGEVVPKAVPDILRALQSAAVGDRASSKSSAPKKSGSASEVIRSESGSPLVRVDAKDRKGISITLLCKGGGTRAEADAALKKLLDQHWPAKQ
jgi:ParB family chromosome partitioning protein